MNSLAVMGALLFTLIFLFTKMALLAAVIKYHYEVFIPGCSLSVCHNHF